MIHVYEIPEHAQQVGFLHGGGKPVPFLMVDWFNEPCEVEGAPTDWGRADLEKELAGKRYRKPGFRYLVVADQTPEFTFVFTPSGGEHDTSGLGDGVGESGGKL